MRPYIICHMVTSIDGRIVPTNWPRKNLTETYEQCASTLNVTSWMVGRTTMEAYAEKKPKPLKNNPNLEKYDFIGNHASRSFAVVLDPSGKCFWKGNTISTEHIIEVLTEKVSTGYLQHLQKNQVSYIFAGTEKINLKLALKKLKNHFGIDKILLEGGGIINGSFMREGLVDEISQLILPVVDGSISTPSIFDIEKGPNKLKPKTFKILDTQKLPNDYLWIRYRAT